jgi:ADP-ribosylglycohydrolase
MEKAAIQATITHNTVEGIASSEAIALMSHFTLYRFGKLEQLPDFLRDTQGLYWDEEWMGEVECHAYQSVDAVLTLLSGGYEKMSHMLLDAVNFGGDVDTVASLALAIASNSDEVENDLPWKLTYGMEGGEYGKMYLKKIDQLLLGKMQEIA